MLTKKNRALFRVLPAIMGAALLAGCKPPGPKALLDGQRLLERGQVPKAIERLRVATDLLGTNAVAWNYLGIAYHQDGQVSNAVTAYKRALAANPDLTETRMNLGMLWLEQGRGGEAKSEFTAYTLRRPNAPEGFLKLAAAELRLREFGLAELHARRAVQLNDANPEGWNTLGLIQLQQRRTRDAAQSFGAALRQRPDYAPALLNLAIVSQQQFGDRATAIKLYRQYIETKPRPADADRVVQIIRQLESELAPVRPSATVPSPPTTQTVQVAAKPVVTNSPAMRSVPVSTAVPVSKPEPVAPKPVVVNPVPSRPAPKVVELPPEPEIRTVPVAEAPKSVVVSAPAVRSAAAPSSISTAPAPTDAVADSAEPKRTFLQSINPINLFRRDAKPAQPTPLPPTTEAGAESDPGPTRESAGAPTAPATIASSTPSRSVSQLAASNLSQFPRYQYRGGGNLTPGDRSTAQRYADRGVRALGSKSFAEARIAFAAAVQADPSWFQAQFNYAACALESRRIQESLGAGEAALALEPKSVDARYNFALALKEGNYVVDAALELERLLTANPTDARAHLTLGNLYAEDLRRPDLARSHYLKVLELEPRHPRRDVIRHWLAANPGH